MSYCRFSSDDHQCDVYVFESVNGFEVHVAAMRVVFKEPLPPQVPMEDVEAFVARIHHVSKMLEQATWTPIRLSHDGASFTFDDPRDCADFLLQLKAEGYLVPQYAINALQDEIPT